MRRKDALVALDVGCSDGYVTMKRLSKKNGFSKVVGIDISELAISEAKKEKQKNKHDIYSFYTLDIESNMFVDALRAIMNIEGVKSFDIIYFAFSLHLLDNPVNVLQSVNQFLSNDGVIIARGVDDDAQIGYAVFEDGTVDEATSSLVKNNIYLSCKTKGIGRRFFGRQFYSWLSLAGYTDIKFEYSVTDNVGISLQDRENLFEYFFSFRRDFTEKLFLKEGDNPEVSLHHKKMLTNLELLRDAIVNNNLFYYMVVSFSVIAKKYIDSTSKYQNSKNFVPLIGNKKQQSQKTKDEDESLDEIDD